GRRGSWLVVAALAFVLSYATKEATFLSIAIFGSFFVAALIWEVGIKIPVRSRFRSKSPYVRFLPRMGGLPVLLGFALVCMPLAKWFFGWMKDTSVYVTKNTAVSDMFVQHLKDQTIAVLPWICVPLVILLLGPTVYERRQKRSFQQPAIIKRIDPLQQPLLATLTTISWLHWLLALLAGATVFVLLFSVLFTNFPSGIADGIWQGLYYWLKQQQVARGGQPWFYYLLLFPLYEQIGVVFAFVGIARCLRRPSHFRLFLVYWFLGNLFIYSWAGEKMPWLMIHMTMPMLLLAALGLEPLLVRIVNLVRNWQLATKNSYYRVQSGKKQSGQVAAIFGAFIAIVLLALTLQNMFQVSYVHSADGPHEMMIYVQTTTDVNVVMSKIDALDQRLYGGKHQLSIGVVPDVDWPFYWYLRDYTNACYGFPTNCGGMNPAVIITGGENIEKHKLQYASSTLNGKAPAYLFHQYHLRMWWDEGYKPLACVASATNSCEGQPTWGGVGPFSWLSYGDTPPAQGQVDPGLAIVHTWQWWWERRAIGSTTGTTDMGLLIRGDLSMNP
nr:hypothetical protein [Ktedonobacteraceae bacterium]